LALKRLKAVNGTPSQSYGMSRAVWDHVLTATRHKWTHPAWAALTPARQAGTRFTYP